MTKTDQGYQKILAATDFSPHACAALSQAVWLARRCGASVTLAHTLPDLHRLAHAASVKAKLDLVYGEGHAFEKEVRRDSDAKMRRMVAEISAADVEILYETLLGEPFVEIIHAVQQEHYDLVLSGTRGLSTWERFFLGSTAKRLIRKCPSSVWIVKAEHVGPPSVVLAATDFSEVSSKGVKEGLWIAQQAGAKFHLLHVIDEQDAPDEVLAKIPDGGSIRDQINHEAKRRLDAFLETIPVDRASIQAHIVNGKPWKEITRMAQHLSADLVAIGTVGRSGIRGMLLGNTAEKVLDTCDCSILTVKPDDFVSPIHPAYWSLHPEPAGPGA